MRRRNSKYGNKKAYANEESFKELAGRRFDSQLERDRACQLVLLQRGKEIRGLEFQKTVHLTMAALPYKADFYYEEFNGVNEEGEDVFRPVWEDAKGFPSERWRIIKKLWKYYGPGKLRISKRGHGNRITVTEEVVPHEG